MRHFLSHSSYEVSVGHMYEADPLATLQFSDTMRRSVHFEPEKRLMLAVLDDAFKSFQNTVTLADNKSKKLFRETEEWFWDKDTERIFGFDHICSVLGLGPDYIRRMLVQWKSKAIADARDRTRASRRRKKSRKRLRYAA
jgi:hypothetical protein